MIVLYILLFLILAVLVISYICFRMAFYASRKPDTGDFPLPEGEIYEQYRDQMAAFIREARAMPQEKVEKLEEIDSQKPVGGKLAFLGDGINDAPVLARADVGIAMGGLGADAAIEAADVVLMTDEPAKLVEALEIARVTRRIVVQNIVFALGIKGIFLLLGALGYAGMWVAVFGDVGVALLAVLNAMRIQKK